MINKGKGKLKWERDMPRDIEEKLEVIFVMVIVQTEFISPFDQFAFCYRADPI